MGTLGAVKVRRDFKVTSSFRLNVEIAIWLDETFRIENGTTDPKNKNWPWIWYESPSWIGT